MLAAAPVHTNPCNVPAMHLICPDLRMPPANGLEATHRHGRTLLLMNNRLTNVGPGPVEIKAHRASKYTMTGFQLIKRTGGRAPMLVRTGALVVWKFVDGRRGYYWKFNHAARFELWATDGHGYRTKRVRTGPKLDYCLRDLFQRRRGAAVPNFAHYPACSQNFSASRVTLGISVGWADGYPYDYPQNWIDVTGLTGCYVIVQIADPLNHIDETNEKDNVSTKMVRLPYRGGAPGCPRYKGVAREGAAL